MTALIKAPEVLPDVAAPVAPEFHLNEKYLPLWVNRDVRYFLVTGGRGSGKSFIVANWLNALFETETPHVALYTRQTMTAADQSVVTEFENMIEATGYVGNYQFSGNNVKHSANGNEILFRGIMSGSKNQTARLKSIPRLSIWIVDEAEEMNDEKDFNTINFSMRQKGVKNRVVICMNPCHVSHYIWQKFYKGKMPDGSDVPQEFNGVIGNACYIHTTYLENLQNLDPDFVIEALTMKETDLKKYNHLFRGHWLHELEGALWDAAMIKAAQEKGRQIDQNKIEIIVIGVDPSVADAATDEQDEAGLIVVGKTVDGDYLVMDDLSGILSPSDWGFKALRAYIDYDADYIIAEVNQGGDLVELNLRNAATDERLDDIIDKDAVPIETVRATKSKLLRADPVATLYKRGKVGHLPGLTKLENELQSYTGAGQLSPGRLDALVWAVTYLTQKSLPRIRQG